MALTLTFDARFTDDLGVGQAVDADLYVEFYEQGNPAVKETRVLGSSIAGTVVQSSDAQGVFYSTVLDVGGYLAGDVTAKWYAKQTTIPLDIYPYVETLAYPFQNVLNASTVADYVRTMLGHPAVVVEISSEHVNAVIQEALDLYNTFLADTKVGVITLVPSQSAYPLPMVSSRGVYDVQFIHKETSPLLGDPLFGRLYPRSSRMEFDMYVLGLSFWETLRRVTGIKPVWNWTQNNKTLYINVGDTNIAGGTLGSYWVAFKYRDDVALSQVPQQHQYLFKRFCLARAKVILGNIRGKFSGTIPAPGGALTLNSAALAAEGAAETQEFEKRIRGLQPPAIPLRF